MRFAREEEEDPGLGITPLVDVVLLLLIFYVVTTSFVKPSLDVMLPEAESGAPSSEPAPMVVTITAGGEIRTEGKVVDLDELGARLADLAEDERRVELRADDGVRHGRVVEVLDVARRNGVLDVGIAVDRPPSDG